MRFFETTFLNGPAGDPALYVELNGEGRSILFDCGKLHRMKPAQALRLTDVFVTHTHIDHFVGFDQLLRILLGSDRRVRIWGPRVIIGNVEGKLAGYTWNLVDGQTLEIEAVELCGGEARSKTFNCGEAFSPGRRAESLRLPGEGRALSDGTVEIRYAELDHIIPSIAYSASGMARTNVDPEALGRDGLEAGPWLGPVKEAAASGADGAQVIRTPAGGMTLGEFRERYVRTTRGEKIAYVADSLYSEANLAKVVPLAAGADVLFCEGGFLECDAAKAAEARHLTASQAGRIGREAGCGSVEIFHFSPKYSDRFDDLYDECELGFRGLAGAGPDCGPGGP